MFELLLPLVQHLAEVVVLLTADLQFGCGSVPPRPSLGLGLQAQTLNHSLNPKPATVQPLKPKSVVLAPLWCR